MSNYTLTYSKEKSQTIYVEKVVNDKGERNEDLYFKREYNEALSLIDSIVKQQDQVKNNKNVYSSINNRILFMGQRGSGKTSVMVTLSNYLEDAERVKYKPENDNKGENKDGNDSKKEKEIECRFLCLPMVDPSHFDNNNNILLTVITSMFSKAKNEMKTREGEKDAYNREELLKQFESVFKSLKSIKSELSTYDLESLNSKSDAEDLKEKMNNLVDKYLNYLTDNPGKKSKLILLIDDIDMSVSFAPEMLEQLRKYLELNNLIILMSANLGQLYNEMREKYSSAFQYTLKDTNQALNIDVEDLATKYLLKLFPTSRRINVERHVNQFLETELIVEGWNDKKDKEKNFQKVILSLIWDKTRLLFIPKDPKTTLHPIIPTNLRDLAQFLDMLTTLNPVESKRKEIEKNGEKEMEYGLFKDKTAYDSCRDNIRVFQNYFMKTWIPNHLKVEEELVFRNIPADITEINKHLINSINIIGNKHKDDLMSREVGLDIIERNADNVYIDRDIYTMVSPNDPKFVKANKISDIFNQPSNYSYGDLLLMIDKYETYFESEEHRKFTDAIKIYYSILLFETMFFKSGDVVYDVYDKIAQSLDDDEKGMFSSETELKTSVKSVYKKKNPSNDEKKIIHMLQEKISNTIPIIPIQKLIGGNVYYPNYFEIITDKNFNQKGPSYDAKRAFYHKIEVDGKGKNVENKCPLFAVLYYGDIRPDRYDKNHIYDTKFQANAEVDSSHYVTFDILSILNNMLNPCQTIGRLDSSNGREIQTTWFDKIQEWGNINRIEDTKTHTPNAILPFYSVDIMLQYLSQSYSASMVTGQDSKYKNEKNLIADGCKSLYSFSHDTLNSKILEGICQIGLSSCQKQLSDSTLKDKKKQTIIDSISKKEWDKKSNWKINITKDNYKDYLDVEEYNDSKKDDLLHMKISDYNEKVKFVINIHDLIKEYKSDLTVEKIRTELEKIKNKKDVTTDKVEKYKRLLTNLTILEELFDKYKQIKEDKKNLDVFRDYVISLLLEQYSGSKKDRDGLIKELRKFTTISEIYKQLVEVLWENAIMELLIRADIQAKVRKPKSVGKYYELLWEETIKMLNCITTDQTNPKVIYNDLYQKADRIFIPKQTNN